MSLRIKIYISILAVFILSMACLLWFGSYSQFSATENIQQEITKYSDEFSTSQTKRMNQKISIITKLFAGSAKEPVINSDYNILDDYCKDICNDHDIILGYVTDKNNRILTKFQNDKNAILRSLIPENTNSIDDIVKALTANEGINTIKESIVGDNGDVLGAVKIITVAPALANKMDNKDILMNTGEQLMQ